MSVVLTYGSGVPTVKVGRMAGQFTKPRSSPAEVRDTVELPSFRGDTVNGYAFDAEARRPDPARLVRAYHQSAATLNLLRAFAKGGFADLSRVHAWNQEFVAASPEGRRYDVLAAEIERAMRFMSACGIDLNAELALHQVDVFTAHEALLLEYEEALTRQDSITGDWYDCSAHLLWIGSGRASLGRARGVPRRGAQPDRREARPGRDARRRRVAVRAAQPAPVPGRLVLFSRMGADHVGDALPPLLQAVRRGNHPVLWACDPMHGNTFVHTSGYKTRRFDDVIREVRGFFAACEAADVSPGGLHVELTGDNVTECLGGSQEVLDEHLERRYETICDPRLNARQSLDLAFEVAGLLRR